MVNVSEWFVSYPINNYNVTLNIGDYEHFSEAYISEKDTLRMDYYVLHDNLEKAKEHFKQVKAYDGMFRKIFWGISFLE